MDIKRANQELKALYERYHDKPRTPEFEEFAKCFCRPQLLWLPDSWANATHRIAYVGREPYGAVGNGAFTKIETVSDFFNCTDGVDKLVAVFDASSEFFATTPNPRGKFWLYCRRAYDLIRASGSNVSIVSSNIIHCAVKTQPTKLEKHDYAIWPNTDYAKAYLDWKKGLLSEELRVIAPTLILFVNGVCYDQFFTTEYPDLHYINVEEFDGKVRRLEAGDLRCPAYRTYHHPQAHDTNGFEPIRCALRDAKLIPPESPPLA